LLPAEFISYTRELFGEAVWQQYLHSFDEPTPVSVRLNPFKPLSSLTSYLLPFEDPVPHCKDAYYLTERPNFTLDPLLHAGAYYVQEASSMYLDKVIREELSSFNYQLSTALDLCAAPGGKSTLLRAALPEGVKLFSNEPDRKRANILVENMQKQGHPNVVVTNSYASDYKKSGLLFDLILTDVPCSGEGMFRKDPATIKEWSVQNVMKCQQLQRSIISDIWDCLRPGGILIYSTCTFNRHEDEENIEWIKDSFEAEEILPAKRFIPGVDRGEGLFMAVLRKMSTDVAIQRQNMQALRILSPINSQLSTASQLSTLNSQLSPSHASALSIATPKDKYPRVELSREDALKYLRRESLILPEETPRGYVIVTYQDLPLGFVKNIGTRANNLYPKEWKIRNL
jgi:16S rRNA C967 or C1407 C5-methylase (RsmB/RsmF family)